MSWPCGHVERLDLAWLPDERVRRRRAVETARGGACPRCGRAPAPGASVIGLPGTTRPGHGMVVAGQAQLDDALGDGRRWIEIAGAAPVVIASGAPGARVDVLPGARAVARAGAPLIRSWGHVRAEEGSCVAAASGSTTVLDGGSAAVSADGLLIARRGLAVVDAGATTVVEAPGPDDEVGALSVRALPWSRTRGAAGTRLVMGGAGGSLITGPGPLAPAREPLGAALAGLLEASRAMGPRP